MHKLIIYAPKSDDVGLADFCPKWDISTIYRIYEGLRAYSLFLRIYIYEADERTAIQLEYDDMYYTFEV